MKPEKVNVNSLIGLFYWQYERF